MKKILLILILFSLNIIIVEADSIWQIQRHYQKVQLNWRDMPYQITEAQLKGNFYEHYLNHWREAGNFIIENNRITGTDFHLEYFSKNETINSNNFRLEYKTGIRNMFRQNKWDKGGNFTIARPDSTFLDSFSDSAHVTLEVVYNGIFETPHSIRGNFTETYYNLVCEQVSPGPITPGARTPTPRCEWIRTRVYSGDFLAVTEDVLSALPTTKEGLANLTDREGLTPFSIALISAASVALASYIFRKKIKIKGNPNVLDGHAVNKKGQVYYKPPWEEAGPYWMDRDEFLKTRKMEKSGKVWSEYGWTDKKDLIELREQRRLQKLSQQRLYEQRLKAQQERREYLKRQSELYKKYIQGSFDECLKDLVIHPDEIEISNIFRKQAIEIKQRPIIERMNVEQQNYERMMQRIEVIDRIELPVKVVQKVCDVTIKKIAPKPLKIGYTITKNIASELAKTPTTPIKALGRGGGKSVYDIGVSNFKKARFKQWGLQKNGTIRNFGINYSADLSTSIAKDVVFEQKVKDVGEKSALEFGGQILDSYYNIKKI